MILGLAVIAGPDFRFGPDFRTNSKVIDPSDPGFDPDALRFEDYNNYADLTQVLSAIFPAGTPQSHIETIISLQSPPNPPSQGPVSEAIKKSGGDHTLRYEFPRLYFPKCLLTINKNTRINFYFDNKNQLLFFHILHGCGVSTSDIGRNPK